MMWTVFYMVYHGSTILEGNILRMTTVYLMIISRNVCYPELIYIMITILLVEYTIKPVKTTCVENPSSQIPPKSAFLTVKPVLRDHLS